MNEPVLLGEGADQVVELVRERVRAENQGPFEDGRRLGLVLEGGGMKAAASAGGALALGHLGAGEVFDDVYATSAAVMNASYLLSGQGDLGIHIYFEDLIDERFFHPMRLWKVLDVEFVTEVIAKESKPLDCQGVLDAFPDLHVAVMDRDTAEPAMLHVGTTDAPLLDILHAAMAIPVFYNRSVSIEGRRFVDGGLKIPFPIEAAIKDGCTDILVLLSHSQDYFHPAPVWWQKALFRTLFSGGNTPVSDAFAFHHLVSRDLRDLVLGRTKRPEGVNVFTICCPESVSLGTTTKDRSRLKQGATEYGRATLQAFGCEDWASWEIGPSLQ
ncbi:MAG: patatin-like phospholipase family protein [Verrucomicrobiota bacterium]